MEVVTRVICGFMVFLIIAWISGCSNKFANDIRRSSDYTVVSKLHPTSKFMWEKDVIRDQNTSFQFLNKHPFSKGNRYTYNYTSKGSYSFCCYKVQPGDTLFYIAWITGNDYRVLARNNNININDILKIGQILEVNNGRHKLLNKKILKQGLKNHELERDIKISSGLNISVLGSPRDAIHSNDNSKKCYIPNKRSVHLSSVVSNCNSQKSSIHKSDVTALSNRDKIVLGVSSDIKGKSSVFWSWPAVGKVINVFSSSEGGNKGIDISGIIGQPVFSARSGKVLYTGNALFGYGNLIIIKHDNDFLSIYAHNDKVLVIEQENVIVGQKIATMGNSGSNIVKLHFEIRYKGQSVDPLFYLPSKNDLSNKK